MREKGKKNGNVSIRARLKEEKKPEAEGFFCRWKLLEGVDHECSKIPNPLV